MDRKKIVEELESILSQQNRVQIDSILADGLSSTSIFGYEGFEVGWSEEEEDTNIVFKFYIGKTRVSAFTTYIDYLDEYIIGDKGNPVFEQVYIRIRSPK